MPKSFVNHQTSTLSLLPTSCPGLLWISPNMNLWTYSKHCFWFFFLTQLWNHWLSTLYTVTRTRHAERFAISPMASKCLPRLCYIAAGDPLIERSSSICQCGWPRSVHLISSSAPCLLLKLPVKADGAFLSFSYAPSPSPTALRSCCVPVWTS